MNKTEFTMVVTAFLLAVLLAAETFMGFEHVAYPADFGPFRDAVFAIFAAATGINTVNKSGAT